jgi:hypothetical protein
MFWEFESLDVLPQLLVNAKMRIVNEGWLLQHDEHMPTITH